MVVLPARVVPPDGVPRPTELLARPTGPLGDEFPSDLVHPLLANGGDTSKVVVMLVLAGLHRDYRAAA